MRRRQCGVANVVPRMRCLQTEGNEMTTQVNDQANILAGASWPSRPFDVVVTTGTFPSRDALDAAVGSAIKAPRVLSIGVDPTHRFVSVHFGKGLGIESSEFTPVRASGNQLFREGRWNDGVDAITAQAEAALPKTHSTVVVEQRAEESSSLGWWIGGAIFLAVVIGLVIWVRRRDRAQAE